jgi:hypothetical protein
MSAAVAEVLHHREDQHHAEYRRGFEAGRRSGVASVLNAPALEEIAMKCTLLEAINATLVSAVQDLERTCNWFEDGYIWERDRAEAFKEALSKVSR